MRNRILLSCALLLLLMSGASASDVVAVPAGSEHWDAKLDGRVRFYQATELGVLVAGTEKSLYGLDAETGDVLWRRESARLDENDVAYIPGTDVLLACLERGDKTRLEAIDLATGNALWRADKVRGAVMQLAFEPNTNALAVVFVKDARSHPREGFKRRPALHVFDLASGAEMWKQDLESEVEMMPALAVEGEKDEVSYTLDNYRPPLFLDGRLYLFYEGLTSLDARTGKERRREKFRINEEGLALTESDPTFDERYIYISGRGRLRAISRTDGEVAWESKDLGVTPEMILTRDVIYVRTGGQFTRLADGETTERGPYGVSAIDASSGKILWRYKGADKGITNIALPDAQTIVVADRDDLIFIDAATGKRRSKISHEVEKAAFVLLNERGEAVVGGRNEVAAFDVTGGRNAGAVWRARHDPPGRGVLRTVASIAARAASLYFRYGGVATNVFRGAQVLSSVSSLRWSGLAAHVTVSDLTTLATNESRDYVSARFSSFGLISRARQTSRTLRNPPAVAVPRPSVEVEDRLLDRLDPANQLARLSRLLWHRQRLATLRGQWMYFYTDLKKVNDEGGHGLLGVNINTGEAARALRLKTLDERFISDEATDLLYVSKDNHLLAYDLNTPE